MFSRNKGGSVRKAVVILAQLSIDKEFCSLNLSIREVNDSIKGAPELTAAVGKGCSPW